MFFKSSPNVDANLLSVSERAFIKPQYFVVVTDGRTGCSDRSISHRSTHTCERALALWLKRSMMGIITRCFLAFFPPSFSSCGRTGQAVGGRRTARHNMYGWVSEAQGMHSPANKPDELYYQKLKGAAPPANWTQHNNQKEIRIKKCNPNNNTRGLRIMVEERKKKINPLRQPYLDRSAT